MGQHSGERRPGVSDLAVDPPHNPHNHTHIENIAGHVNENVRVDL